MTAPEDFRLWERELGEQPVEQSGGGAGMMVGALLLVLSGLGLIAVGGTPLGVAVLVISILILFLWQAGM